MTDPMSVGAAIGMLNNAFSVFKHVKELSFDSGDLNLKEAVAELYDKLLDVKEKLIELEDENRKLRQQLASKNELERRPPFGYWYKKGENDPLCRVCYERDGKLIYLDAEYRSIEDGTISRWCRGCQQTFFER